MEIIKVAFVNGVGKTNGCKKAPREMLKILKQGGSSQDGKIINYKKLNINEIKIKTDSQKKINEKIFEESFLQFKRNKKTIFLGGDHSITYHVAKAFNKTEKNPLLIVIDAHADCVKVNREPVNGEWLCKLIESGFSGAKVIIFSARNMWKEELEFIKKHKIKWITMRDIRENFEETIKSILTRVKKSSGFYISVDIDAVDPGFSPGVTYPEPGGITSNQLIQIVQELKSLRNFKGADIVEINPDKDINNITVKLGAKILIEMI